VENKIGVICELVALFALLMFLSTLALGQETKEFSSDGMSFRYPKTWVVEDTSTDGLQQLYLWDKANDGTVRVIVSRKKYDSKSALGDVKKQIIEPWVEQLVKQYSEGGVTLKREPLTDKIGEVGADGIKFSLFFDSFPGTGVVLWALLDKRLVLLYFVRADKTAQQADAGWNILKTSFRISEKYRSEKK
jgi:hypothetical protein